jgi:hypothetical protein
MSATAIIEVEATDTSLNVANSIHVIDGTMRTVQAYRDNEQLDITPDMIIAQLALVKQSLVNTLDVVD